jgi:molybdopterin synthase catalytic subunit
MCRKFKNIFIEGPVSPDVIADAVSKHSNKTNIGAHSIFLGQVRSDEKPEGIVEAIEYTAYVEMALEKINHIREEIFSRYSLACVHIYHSLGRVKAGEICLFVFTSSTHRKDAIHACDELVDQIKKELPIWGKEIIDHEKFLWKVNKEN